MNTPSESAMDARARRAALRAGYIARKSRWHVGTTDNHGGFALFDAWTSYPAAAADYSFSAEDVIEWCRDDDEVAA
jgi:hypothetical protein